MTHTEEVRRTLYILAAEMAVCKNMPQADTWPWSTRASEKLARAAEKAQADAEEQCRKWALAVRAVADRLL